MIERDERQRAKATARLEMKTKWLPSSSWGIMSCSASPCCPSLPVQPRAQPPIDTPKNQLLYAISRAPHLISHLIHALLDSPKDKPERVYGILGLSVAF